MTNFKYVFSVLKLLQEIVDDERIPLSIREEYMDKFSDIAEKKETEE